MVVPSPKPVTPSEQTILTIINVCACMVATDRKMRANNRQIDDVRFDVSWNVEARRLEKFVVERCMISPHHATVAGLLKGMERYHRK